MSIDNIDKIETGSVEADVTQIPHDHRRELYVHRKPLPGSNFSNGDLAGYDEDGDLWVVETEGWEYHDRNGNQTDGEVFLDYTSEALNLEVAGYLDPSKHFGENNFVSGEDLYEIADRNLEGVEKRLDDENVVV